LHGDYDSFSQLYDDIVRGYLGRGISIVFAVGNEEDDGDCPPYPWNQTTGPGGTAKNTISVGAVNSDDLSLTSFSSWGPTDDGRIKPDIMAPGCENETARNDGVPTKTIWSTWLDDTYWGSCGTSMAAPAVSGIIALIHEAYRKVHNGSDPLPSTVKAILIHTAKDLNETGPDFITGWGLVNATAAIDIVRKDNGTGVLIIEDTITQGINRTYEASVQNSSPLKVTLVWDDYPGEPFAAKELVNDLDLMVLYPNGSIVYPWKLDAGDPSKPATRGVDDVNNVEQVLIETPISGTYKIIVKGTSIPQGPQNFSLILSEKDNIKPTITIFSPLNKTYIGVSVDLNYSVSEPTSKEWVIVNGENRSGGNQTLTGLIQGSNNVTVYAVDIAGNLNSSTVYFTLYYPIKNLNTSQNYTSIQAAIDNASVGDTILLSLDTHIENVVVNKSINLVGELGAIVRAANSTLPIFNITAEYVNISGISFSGSNIGVLLSSGNSSISNCTFYSLNKSIYVANSSGNSIYNNTITNNAIGIYLQVSSNNTLYNNTLKENSYGIYLNSSYNNSIYHNNIINSTLLQACDNGNNTWDSGYPNGGNFWSNWTSPDRNGDGVVDYPYPLGNNTDSYPVIQADGWLLIQPDATPPSIHIESPDNGSYLNTSWVFVNVTINETAWLVHLEWNNGTANNYTMNEIACYRNNTCWVSNITATDGNYSFKIYAEDSVGLWNTSESRIIIIDTIRPHVENLTVTPLKPLVGSLTNITVNVSDLNLDSVRLNITLPNGTSLMYQMTLLGGVYYYNFTASSFGTYKAQIIANDSAGNVNNTVEITFWGVETFSNSSTLPNGTSKLVINESIIKINISAAENASAKVELNITIAPESKTFNIPEISNSTSEADKGIKFLNISSNLTNVSSIKIQLYYTSNETEGLLESSLSLCYWNGSRWVSTASYRNETIPGGPFVYDAGVNTDEDYVWAVVNHSSIYGIGGLIDSDGDGIADRDDACPNEMEDDDGYQDSDGCPEPGPTILAAGGGGGAAARPRIVLLANSIDLNLSSGFFGFLRNEGIDIVYVNASNFSEYRTEKFIVILGGPDALEGVGEIVREILNESEQEELRTPGAKKIYMKANVWRSYNQVVMVIAGSGRDQTREAEEENKFLVRKKVKGS
jgi:parallel beta-helix repeat protein